MRTRRRGASRTANWPKTAICLQRPSSDGAITLRWLFAMVVIVVTAAILRATPVITEFMASNQQSVADGDGAYADWIELHNPDAEPVDLTGWYLTDNAARKTKWSFPAVTIPPGGYLVVFASEKDRRDPAGALHTNFALSADGEYLGLVAPDGATVASEFAPRFPAQMADVSYGVGLGAGGTPAFGFLSAPTPGAANTALRRPSVRLGDGELFSSGMPILVIDQQGRGPISQADGERPAALALFEADVPTLTAPIGLKVRGSSSADFPKQSFSIELHDEDGTNRRASLLGLSKASDWALVSPWLYDTSYLRNAFMYALSNRIGRWAPRTAFVETFVNEDSAPLGLQHYAGISVLTERIEIDAERVAIQPLSSEAAAGADPITGGYILKIDPRDPDEFGWVTSRGIPDPSDTPTQMLIVVAPKADRITPAQQEYIRDYVQRFEDALFADRESGWARRAYLEFIDRASWVDYHLLQVLAKNPDGLERSTYFHKDRGGKLKAGPLWDFDRALGSTDPRSERWDEWAAPENAIPFWDVGWWSVLARDPDFVQAWVDRWQMLRRGALSNESLAGLVESLAAQIDPGAAATDAARWTENASRFGTHRGEVEHLIGWLTNRAGWIDRQFVPAPEVIVTDDGVQVIAPPGQVIAYTTDGTDPRESGGTVAAGVTMAGGSFRIPPDTAVVLRIYNPNTPAADTVGTSWSSPWSSGPAGQ